MKIGDTMEYSHLCFNSYIGQMKPENIVNKEAQCPFCDRHKLVDVIAEQGPILLVKNKYPVLQETFQTVLIETYTCEEELSTYSKDHLYDVINFGIKYWLEMHSSGEYKSVLFFKNHGRFSGGTIRHPHMQIVGLKNVDYHEHLRPEHFEGMVIDRRQNAELNLSTKPRVGFFEFNGILTDLAATNDLADYIQVAAHYILNGFHKNCTSYNLFFYHLQDKVAVKIMPRFVMSPIYVGYSIPQVSNRLDDVGEEIHERYFK